MQMTDVYIVAYFGIHASINTLLFEQYIIVLYSNTIVFWIAKTVTPIKML